ncbi:Spo0B domain-containing protein [Jeotgalibacillus proteolyticus]|nr:Spo0B domain-containing protein [Jeotgalibacillus proteolyticus]
MKDVTRSLELLQHSRHDWLNRLQVIKGNLELANIDRAKEIIDEIIIEARQEAQLSSLGTPRLSEWLLTYNWGSSKRLALKFEFLNEGRIPGELDFPLFRWLTSAVDKIEQSVPANAENELYLIFRIEEEHCNFRIALEYEGGTLSCSPSELIVDADGPVLYWKQCSDSSFIVETAFNWAVSKQDG